MEAPGVFIPFLFSCYKCTLPLPVWLLCIPCGGHFTWPRRIGRCDGLQAGALAESRLGLRRGALVWLPWRPSLGCGLRVPGRSSTRHHWKGAPCPWGRGLLRGGGLRGALIWNRPSPPPQALLHWQLPRHRAPAAALPQHVCGLHGSPDLLLGLGGPGSAKAHPAGEDHRGDGCSLLPAPAGTRVMGLSWGGGGRGGGRSPWQGWQGQSPSDSQVSPLAVQMSPCCRSAEPKV